MSLLRSLAQRHVATKHMVLQASLGRSTAARPSSLAANSKTTSHDVRISPPLYWNSGGAGEEKPIGSAGGSGGGSGGGGYGEDLSECPNLRAFNQELREAAVHRPEDIDYLVLERLKLECEPLTRSPILRPWAQDVLNANTLANATSRVLARKICGSEAGLEMDVQVNGLNDRVEYLIPVFETALMVNEPCVSLDLLAIATKDPAANSYLQPFLWFKGFHAVALQRISHQFWVRANHPSQLAVEALRVPKPPPTHAQAEHAKALATMLTPAEAHYSALWLQCRCSEVFGVDMHPGARLGKGMFMDHATGIVIGETATIGDDCSLLHNVTLGGTGKPTATRLRHPQIGNGVTIGSCASVLGDISIGQGATVGAQAVVTKPVAPGCTVIGLNQVLTARQEKAAVRDGANSGTWWAELGCPSNDPNPRWENDPRPKWA